MTAETFGTLYSTVEVQDVDGNTYFVEVVPENLVYFIDSAVAKPSADGALASTEAFDAVKALLGDKLDIYSGNDDEIVPILSMGGQGVISVLSNLLPKETSELCHKFFAGDVAGAAAMQCKYLKLIRALFSEVNPIPVKAAMAAMGFCEDYLRLPLTPMEDQHRQVLLTEMRRQGLKV